MLVPAAPLDTQARLVLVAWLCAWFAVVAALMGLSVAGGSTVALAAGLVVAVAVPTLVLGRLASLPVTYEVDGDRLYVHRYLATTRRYRLRGPARRAGGTARLSRRQVLLGGGYGCRTVAGVGGSVGSERVHLATTSLAHLVEVPTASGPLLVSPDDEDALVRAITAASEAPS